MASALAIMMALTMLPATAFAAVKDSVEPSTETVIESEGDAGSENSSGDAGSDTPSDNEESDTSFDDVDSDTSLGSTESEDTDENDLADQAAPGTAKQAVFAAPAKAAAVAANNNSYEVSSDDELKDALDRIATSGEQEAVIVLKADVSAPRTPESPYVTSFGVGGGKKHITVKSEDGEIKRLSFISRGILRGACTFDNVNVTGGRLFCNGYKTIFTENGQIHLSETLYGGGYQTTVASTHVEIAATGYINPSSSSGLHDVIGGSYQGLVEGDTYLEITGDIKMQSGNHLNPGCMKGDGSSGDGRNVPDVYVGGNATLIYDNKNSADTASPAIEGTYGCEMKGDVTLDVRAGSVAGIVGTEEPVDKSIIRGNLHIIAGNPAYENTDQVLRLGSNWPIIGAGNSFATYPGAEGNYTVDGNITIDTYENAWAWDKGTTPDSYDLPEIYGALRGNVGGNITINAHGSHVQNIFGASDSVVQGSVTVNATDVELKNSEYNTEYDEGYIFGLWERGIPATAKGPVTVNVDGGDVGLVMVTDQTTAPAGSSINVTGKPKIRTGIRGTQASTYSTSFPVANLKDCKATIPFIKMMSQVNVTEHSDVTAHIMTNNAGLLVEEGSTVTTDEGQVWIWGNTVIDGTWEQQHSQTATYNDIFVSGTTQIGSKGHLINHGTSNLKGAVTNDGVMAFMGWALLQNNYTAHNGELRLPVVADGENYDTGTIPVEIKGLSTGTTTVNTVDPADWQTLKKPALGDNYILSKKNTDSPAQNVFVLGNADAVGDGWFLKRMADADGSNDYYMWQVASGIRVIFDKNGGDTEADPRIMVQDKVVGAVNHFDLPTVEPTRSNYKFTGWNTSPDGTGDVFTAETDVKENMTVYAQWKNESETTPEPTPGTTPEPAPGTAPESTPETTPASYGTVHLYKVDGQTGAKLPGAEFSLYKDNGEFVGSYVTDSNGGITVYNMLYDSYYFTETKAPDGYTLDPTHVKFALESAEMNVKFSNTAATVPTMLVGGVKTWNDNNDAAGARPSSITLHLFANGVEVGTTQATADTNWQYTFGAQPVNDANGKAIVYSLSEDEVSGYNTEISEPVTADNAMAINVTNTYRTVATTAAGIATGDDSNMALYGLLSLIAGAGFVGLFIRRKFF